MNTWLVVFISVVVGVILLFALIRFVLYIARRRLARRVNERFAENEIILMTLDANFFGRKSEGRAQVRGNGALVLTSKELWFSLASPRKDISLPLKSIQYVRMEKSFLYKTALQPLLAVRYKTKEFYDEAGWLVPEAGKWVEEIEKRRS